MTKVTISGNYTSLDSSLTSYISGSLNRLMRRTSSQRKYIETLRDFYSISVSVSHRSTSYSNQDKDIRFVI